MATFAEKLKQAREAAGFTQAQLAERAGMHRMSIAKLEQGQYQPSWEAVQALANALGVSSEAFREPGRGRPRKSRDSQ